MSSRSDLLAKLFRLTGAERRILFLSLMLLPAVGLGLRLFGFRRVQTVLTRGKFAVMDSAGDGAAPLRVVTAARVVAAAARHGLYRASCLPIALTLEALLYWQGIPSVLRLGVRRVAGRLEAHAWVEYQGRPLIDTPEIRQRFAAFDPIDSSRSMTPR